MRVTGNFHHILNSNSLDNTQQEQLIKIIGSGQPFKYIAVINTKWNTNGTPSALKGGEPPESPIKYFNNCFITRNGENINISVPMESGGNENVEVGTYLVSSYEFGSDGTKNKSKRSRSRGARKKKSRTLSPYNLFVKNNYHKYRGDFTAIGQAWNNLK